MKFFDNFLFLDWQWGENQLKRVHLRFCRCRGRKAACRLAPPTAVILKSNWMCCGSHWPDWLQQLWGAKKKQPWTHFGWVSVSWVTEWCLTTQARPSHLVGGCACYSQPWMMGKQNRFVCADSKSFSKCPFHRNRRSDRSAKPSCKKRKCQKFPLLKWRSGKKLSLYVLIWPRAKLTE